MWAKVFRKTRDGLPPATKVYEDDRVMAILNIHQPCEGHTLGTSETDAPADPTRLHEAGERIRASLG